MFDTLTLVELYDLHTSLWKTHTALHAKLIGPDYQPVIDPLSDDWNLISAACQQITETMTATHAEITRRAQEAVNA
jgi:hypothetical protein